MYAAALAVAGVRSVAKQAVVARGSYGRIMLHTLIGSVAFPLQVARTGVVIAIDLRAETLTSVAGVSVSARIAIVARLDGIERVFTRGCVADLMGAWIEVVTIVIIATIPAVWIELVNETVTIVIREIEAGSWLVESFGSWNLDAVVQTSTAFLAAGILGAVVSVVAVTHRPRALAVLAVIVNGAEQSVFAWGAVGNLVGFTRVGILIADALVAPDVVM
jgi:hypothetical protein